MICEVLVRRQRDSFTATLVGLPGCTVEAQTRDEAIERVRSQALDWLSEGKAGSSEIVKIELDLPYALERGAGIFANESEESWNQFLEAMREHRRELNAGCSSDSE
jgi:predicted RNase H-like HicB family nuclease